MPFIAEDIVRFTPDRGSPFSLYWGEEVEVLGSSGGRTQLRVLERGARPIAGSVAGRLPTQDKRPLQFMMIDVQQGDGLMFLTPAGRKVFIDGGDNELFARFAAARFRGSSAEQPLEVDAMVVTHGDADHFGGLSEIRDSETHRTLRKRLFIHPRRVFHNGIVKGPSTRDSKRVPDEELLGATVPLPDGGLGLRELVDDPTALPDSRLNVPFRRWKNSLLHWAGRGPIEFRRLARGDRKAFEFLADEGIEVEVLGPGTRYATVDGRRQSVLEFLREPPKDDNISVAGFDPVGRAYSASHTINGHSITLRLRYGNVRFFLGGDLNQQAMAELNARYSKAQLQSEILKIPHHGSADFDFPLLRTISPAISLISSGDESSRTEYIHPRATLLGALGRIARSDVSLVFSTELAAFFELRGWSKTADGKRSYFGFERTNFGIVHIRTDGERILVFTHSGKQGMNEAYRLDVDARGKVTMAKSIARR
jgi:beta-lactamase superfamily II metal-dependent hydrolase